MAYKIRYFQGLQPTGDEVWTGSLAEAKVVARNAVDSGAAERVEVLHGAGSLAFHYPRIAPNA